MLYVILMRSKQMNIRLDDAEIGRLARVAAHYGISTSAALRMLIKLEDDRLQAAVANVQAPLRAPPFEVVAFQKDVKP